jgi:hypothetical protein
VTGPLTEQARALAERVGGLISAVEQLHRRTNRAERVQKYVVFGLLLDLVLSVAVAFVVANQFNASYDLRAAVEREATTRNQGICPLYSLIIGGYNPDSRPAGPARDSYVQAFKTINNAYTALECKQPPVPPRTDQTSVPVPR